MDQRGNIIRGYCNLGHFVNWLDIYIPYIKNTRHPKSLFGQNFTLVVNICSGIILFYQVGTILKTEYDIL
jgi:hypothetical protein